MTDSCPRCLRRRIQPRAVVHRGDSIACGYHCPKCAHTWATTWDRAASSQTDVGMPRYWSEPRPARPTYPAHTVHCPRCHAPVGVRCTTPRGRKLAVPSHQARIDAYATQTTRSEETQ